MISSRATVHSFMPTPNTMRANGLKMKDLDGEGCISLMVRYTKAIGRKINNMEEECTD